MFGHELETGESGLDCCAFRLPPASDGEGRLAAIASIATTLAGGRARGGREDLGAIIETVVDSVAAAYGPGVEIACGVAPDTGSIHVDRCQIELVLSTLVENACEALADRGGGRIAILAMRSGTEILVQIRDSRPGFSEHALGHLFEPLISVKEGRIGLGMPMCKAILQAHGGQFWFERPADGGALFSLLLPAAA